MNQITVQNEHVWQLSGELTFNTVNQLLTEFEENLGQLPANQALTLDLQAVTRTDSAGLALVIELFKRTKNLPLSVHNIPAQMLSIAKISGVEELLTGQSTWHHTV